MILSIAFARRRSICPECGRKSACREPGRPTYGLSSALRANVEWVCLLGSAARAREALCRATRNAKGEGSELMLPRRAVLGRVILLLGLTLRLAHPTWASHLAVRLTVDGDPRSAQADTDTTPPANG